MQRIETTRADPSPREKKSAARRHLVPADIRTRGHALLIPDGGAERATREEAQRVLAGTSRVTPLLDAATGELSAAALLAMAPYLEPFEVWTRPPREWQLARGLSSPPPAAAVWARARANAAHPLWRVLHAVWTHRALGGDTGSETAIVVRPGARPLDTYAEFLAPTDHFVVVDGARVVGLHHAADVAPYASTTITLVVRLAADARTVAAVRLDNAAPLSAALGKRAFLLRTEAADDDDHAGEELAAAPVWRCEFTAPSVFAPPEHGDVAVTVRPVAAAAARGEPLEFFLRASALHTYALDVSAALLDALALSSVPLVIRLFVLGSGGGGVVDAYERTIELCAAVATNAWAVQWPRGVEYEVARVQQLYALEPAPPEYVYGHELVVSLVFSFDATTATYSLHVPKSGDAANDTASAVFCAPPGGPPPVAVFLYENAQMARGQAPILYEGGACSLAPDARACEVARRRRRRRGRPAAAAAPPSVPEVFTYAKSRYHHPTPATLLDTRRWIAPPNHPRTEALASRAHACAWVGIYISDVHPERAPEEVAVEVLDPQRQLMRAGVTRIRVDVHYDWASGDGGGVAADSLQYTFSSASRLPLPVSTASYRHE
jgi:hypothetical protein